MSNQLTHEKWEQDFHKKYNDRISLYIGHNAMSDLYSAAYHKDQFKNMYHKASNAELTSIIGFQDNAISSILRQIQIMDDEVGLGTIFDARQIKQHWEQLNKFLEENPDIKEQWDAIMCAMRLTQD